MEKLPTTQRAYTLRLRGTNQDDHSWQDALWKTHEAVNKGAKVFGDWLLTLRGGLCHTLAEEPLEHLREQRVKQLASRVAEAALGIGTENTADWENFKKRPRQRINKPEFSPCHAIVIENLENYRPDELQTRRENRQLMQWSSSKVKKYLAESCELNGLHLREVYPGYTSRQDSRTGAAGVRCNDISVKDFLAKYDPEMIKGELEKEKKKSGPEGNVSKVRRLEYILKLYGYWKAKEKDSMSIKGKSVRIPQKGGEIFVSADKTSPLAKGIQADLNAAANIGLRALLDPDWQGNWWYIPCKTKELTHKNDKTKGSMAIETTQKLSISDEEEAKKVKTDYVNIWSNITSDKLGQREWFSTKTYWHKVTDNVIENLDSLYFKDKPIETPW